MKILIVNTFDIEGGAAKAAYRLHRALLDKNVESHMLVQNKSSDDNTVIGPATKVEIIKNLIRRIMDKIPVMFYKHRTKTPFSSMWFPFSRAVDRINEINPDIVHLHWVCASMIPIEDIIRIKAPIVWSLHDMWAFTGGCHYDEECKGYEKECGKCKVLQSSKEKDLSRWIFTRKQNIYNKINRLSIITSSKWMLDCVRNNSLFTGREIGTLPNCIPTNIFQPLNKDIAKKMFNIPSGKKVVLFSAMNPLGDSRKGAKELFSALDLLDVKDTIFVIAGSSIPAIHQHMKYDTYYIPPLHDDVSLSVMYNIADVLVVPSLQENLANSIAEALCCGVPVVGFNIGGNRDMIEHKKTGYLAKAFDIADLANGINWVLSHYDLYDFVNLCHNDGFKKFNAAFVASLYMKKYIKIIEKG